VVRRERRLQRLRQSQVPGDRLLHIGWNEIATDCTRSLLIGGEDGTDFYFAHSYHFQPANPEHSVARTPYCGAFTAVSESADGVMGAQLTPKKEWLRVLRYCKTS